MSHARIGLIVVCTATAGMAWLSAQTFPGSKPIRGFSPASSALELERERELKASPSPKAAEADFDVMTAEPHHTGSPYEIKLADYVAGQFKSFGIG
jgi:N-acetylated-alpha-linked acidic dipeptidase